MTSFIISAREYYLFHIATKCMYSIMLYHKVLPTKLKIISKKYINSVEFNFLIYYISV